MSNISASRILTATLVLAWAWINLAGCKKDNSATGPSDSDIVTVTGKVVNGTLQPVASVPVLISGKVSVNTDANGSFSVADVSLPYDVTIVSGGDKTAYIYRNLARSNPTLYTLGSSPLPNSATISGSVYPTSAFPQPAGRVTGVGLVSTAGAAWTNANGTVSPATYTFSGLSWAGTTTISAAIFALQWNQDGAGLPLSYLLFGTRTGITITSGGTFANVNDTMSITPATLTFRGSIGVPAGYTLNTKEVTEQFSGVTVMLLLIDATNTTTFSYKTPDLLSGTVGLAAMATKGSAQSVAYASSLAPGSTSASLTLPAAPELSLPIDGAPSVKAGTPFSWNAFPNGLHVLYFDGPNGKPDYYIITSAASDSLPSLAASGLPLPSSTTYQWSVMGFAPFSTVDDATGPAGFIPPGFPYVLVAGTGSYAISTNRSFTTAP